MFPFLFFYKSRSKQSQRVPAATLRSPSAWQFLPIPSSMNLTAAEDFCRVVASQHYENFTVATRLVPRRLRQHLANVYAFARWSDDLADELASPEESRQALADWRAQLESCFDGRPTHPLFVALADTARHAKLTIEPFANLLSAFEEDQLFDQKQVRVRYETRVELLEYCRRSANPVGRVVLALEGCHEPELLVMSDSICTGLQLVNFWQDIKRDSSVGRVYLPRQDMVGFGVDCALLDGTRATPQVRALLHAEVAWARACFAAGEPLVKQAPLLLRPAIKMFLAGGRAVADAIERAGFDTLSRRPTVSKWQQFRLAADAWLGLRMAAFHAQKSTPG